MPEPIVSPLEQQEEWRPVIGYEGLYDVSSLGRIQGRCAARLILKPASNGRYLHVCLYRNRKRTTKLLHCLVARAFLGAPPLGQEVNHKDGNKENPRLDNLEYLSKSDNALHAARVTKTWPLGDRNGSRLYPGIHAGELHGRAKVTEVQVLEIRSRYKSEKISARKLGRDYGLAKSTTLRILSRKLWRHI